MKAIVYILLGIQVALIGLGACLLFTGEPYAVFSGVFIIALNIVFGLLNLNTLKMLSS